MTGNSDKTRSMEESINIILEAVQKMVNTLGYTNEEAWQTVSNDIVFRLDSHDFDPPTIEQEMSKRDRS